MRFKTAAESANDLAYGNGQWVLVTDRGVFYWRSGARDWYDDDYLVTTGLESATYWNGQWILSGEGLGDERAWDGIFRNAGDLRQSDDWTWVRLRGFPIGVLTSRR